jgi:hypothetical protein
MKLRNKKTGKVYTLSDDLYIEYTQGGKIELRAIIPGGNMSFYYDSLDKLYHEWEDYKPAEPLIKDEEIRKAVRAWAEVNNVPTDVKLDVFEYLGTGVTAIRYLYKAETLPYERCVQFEYISSDKIYNSQNNRECTITELCGEGEECES